MAFFFWKKGKIISDFAKTMADDFYSNVQPTAAKAYLSDSEHTEAYSTAESSRKKKPHNKQSHLKITIQKLNETITKIKKFKTENSLGVYGKAKLHMAFSQRLQELGYDEETAKKLDRIIMLKTP